MWTLLELYWGVLINGYWKARSFYVLYIDKTILIMILAMSAGISSQRMDRKTSKWYIIILSSFYSHSALYFPAELENEGHCLAHWKCDIQCLKPTISNSWTYKSTHSFNRCGRVTVGVRWMIHAHTVIYDIMWSHRDYYTIYSLKSLQLKARVYKLTYCKGSLR